MVKLEQKCSLIDALQHHDSILHSGGTIGQQVMAYHEYYRNFAGLDIPKMRSADAEKIAAHISEYVQNTHLDLCQIFYLYDQLDCFDDCDELSETCFDTDLLNIAVNLLTASESNYKRLLRVVDSFDVLFPYFVLFERFGDYLDEQGAQKYRARARSIFDEGFLDFLD